MAIAKITDDGSGIFTATLPAPVPSWEGMRVVVVDLNGKGLRVAGGGTVRACGLPSRPV